MKRKRNVVNSSKVLSVVLAVGLLVSSMPGTDVAAKGKKPKIQTTKITLKVGEKKRVKVTNAKKVKWSISKKAKKIVKLSSKSKKGATLTGVKTGTAKISVTMKNGKQQVKKTLTVKVKAAGEAVTTQPPITVTQPPATSAATQSPSATAPTSSAPVQLPTEQPGTEEPTKMPATESPTDTPTEAPSIAPSEVPSEVPSETSTPTPVATVAPSQGPTEMKALDLSKFTNGSKTGTVSYDSANSQLSATNVNYFHIPLTETVENGTEVTLAIRGTYNGTKGFRVWLAGANDGNFSEQLSSTADNIQGDFTWKITLTATDSVGYLEFKGITWEDLIDELTLTGIDVSYKASDKPVATPIAMPTDIPSDKLLARATTAPGTHAVASLPLAYTDIPDMDYIRVGEDYYMVSTTMFLNPGVPIMHSKDLVHWEIISYVYDTLEDNDTTNLKNGKQCYGKGSWAASLRYNEADETFYVCFSSNDQAKTYIYTTKDIAGGTWEKHSASGTKHDPGLLFDNGKMYMVSGNGNITLEEVQLSGDSIQFSGAKTIIKKTASNNTVNIEGSHAYKIGDYYYLFFIEWPGGGKRMEWCYRTKDLTGDWEGKVVFCDDGNYSGAGIAQGGIIDTQYGDYYAILFQDHGPVGRTPVLLDVYWVDGWPMMGSDNGKASASEALDVNLTSSGEDYLYADDDFTYTENKLQLVWQWNHNPDNDNWSVTEREGYLRLRTGSLATSIKDARNSLTQRTYGPTCTSEAGIDVSNMKAGDYAGICAFQNSYGQVGVMKDAEGKTWIYYGEGTKEMTVSDTDKIELTQNTVSLKIQYNFNRNVAKFFYSLDGETWNSIGDELDMRYDLSIFMGYRTYLYNYATTETGGYVDFDYYNIYH